MKQLDLQFVKSSAVTAFAYDEENQRLIALFTSGKWQVYGDFSKEDYEKLLQAGSIGSYMGYAVIGFYPELSPGEV